MDGMIITMEEREKEGKQFKCLEDIFDRYQEDKRKKELEKRENEWKKKEEKKESKKESKKEEEKRWKKKGEKESTEEEKVHHRIHDLNNMDGKEIRREEKSEKESYETEVEHFKPESHQVYLKVDFQETEIEEKSEEKEEEKPQNQKRGKKSLEGNHNNVEPIFLPSGNECEQKREMKGRKTSSSLSSPSLSSFKISSNERIREEERFVEERINLEEEQEGNHWQEVYLRVEEGTERKEEDDLTQGIQVERNGYANEGKRKEKESKENERKETGGKERKEESERREKEGSEGEVTGISTSDQMARRNRDEGTASEEGKDGKRNQSRMLLDEEDERKAEEGEKEIEEKEETERKGEEKEIESEEEEIESEEERIWKESCKRSRCVRRSITSIELDEEETSHSFLSSEERKERSGEERDKDEEDGDWYVKRDGEWMKESEWEDESKRRESQDLIPGLPFSPSSPLSSFSLSAEEEEREKDIFPYHEYGRTISSDSWTSSTTSFDSEEDEDRKKEEGQEKEEKQGMKESGRREGKRKSSLLSAEKKKERDERRRKERRRSRSVSWGTAETIEFLPFPREVIELSKEGNISNVSKLAFHEPSNAWFLSLGFFFTGSLICYRFYSSFYFLFSDPDSQSTASYSYHF